MIIKPCVFAVEDTYQIMVLFEKSALMWVKIGDQVFYDEVAGVMRSETDVHKVVVPMKLLDEAKSYTVCYKETVERKTYNPIFKDEESETFEFRPLTNEHFKAYHICDAHYLVDVASNTAKVYGDIDVLIINGDTPDHFAEKENLKNIYNIAFPITNGNIPVIYSRGNHNLRGRYAEFLSDYAPTSKGKYYYTFRLGPVWGIVLDCAEDKEDECYEYAGTCYCQNYRLEQIDFIKNVIADKENEYAVDGVKYRVVICHIPYALVPWDFEKEIYDEWNKLINENVKPQIIMSAHTHEKGIVLPEDDGRLVCPLVIGGEINYNNNYFVGAGFEFEPDKITLTFTDRYNQKFDITEFKI
ncbi:MAG: metallophosphoesterase [Ruminococcaceae bacterium]|nr:metallophosphoesterase [Oscillospiraceae bacterium]